MTELTEMTELIEHEIAVCSCRSERGLQVHRVNCKRVLQFFMVSITSKSNLDNRVVGGMNLWPFKCVLDIKSWQDVY